MPQLVRRPLINFGKTDAKSAMVTRDVKARELFLNSFVKPGNIDLEAISSGDRFLVYGAKGSGKTALLRYLMEEENKAGNPTKFIIFSEDIPQYNIEAIGKNINIDAILKPDIGNDINVKDMWSIFLIKSICELLSNSKELFESHGENKKLKTIIDNIFEPNNKGSLSRIRDSIKSGTVRFRAGLKEYAELESIINFENPDGTVEVNYSKFAELSIKILCAMEFPKDVKYSLFVDEINLSMVQQRQHIKDSILVRDCILSIGKLNRVFAEKSVPIFLYGAVRVEIARGINVSRNEIDKYLTDHGQFMRWHNALDIASYPIFRVIEHRISAIEKRETGRSSKSSDIWKEYFASDIFDVSPKQFINEITWCNPRDIVNLFNLAATVHIGREKYDSVIFGEIAETYSDLVWAERAEELNTEYAMPVVNAIKILLNGFYPHFNIEQLEKRANNVAVSNQAVAQMKGSIGILKLCRDLYYIGVFGQSTPIKEKDERGIYRANGSRHETWFYRDNREFDESSWLIVHKGLFPTLRIGQWKRNIFGLDPRLSASSAAN